MSLTAEPPWPELLEALQGIRAELQAITKSLSDPRGEGMSERLGVIDKTLRDLLDRVPLPP